MKNYLSGEKHTNYLQLEKCDDSKSCNQEKSD